MTEQAFSAADIRLLCAWCGVVMRQAQTRSATPPESHGICAGCAVSLGVPAHHVR